MTQLNFAKSFEKFEEACGIFPGGVNSPVRAFKSVNRSPFVVAKGEGAYLVDLDGNRFVDFINSWGPLVLGHANSKVIDAISEQAALGTSYGASCGLEIDLARLIQEQMPSLEMLRFVNSGTEAGMSVIRLARGYTGKSKIIKCDGCYHGHADSLLVKAGSGVATFSLPGSAGVPEQFVRDTLVVPFNSVESLSESLRANKDQVAAVILEPVCGNAGLIQPLDDYLSQVRELCDQHNCLLIFDEVMTGFRVDLSGAQGLFNVTPDLTMLGKVIGGGLPVGAFGGKADIMRSLSPLGPVYQAGTLSGNPLAMAAGKATLKEWTQPGVFQSVAKKAKDLVAGILDLASARSIEVQASSCGTMFGLFFSDKVVNNFADAKASRTKRYIKFFSAMLDRGVYFAPSPFEAGFISAAHDDCAMQFVNAQLKEVFSNNFLD